MLTLDLDGPDLSIYEDVTLWMDGRWPGWRKDPELFFVGANLNEIREKMISLAKVKTAKHYGKDEPICIFSEFVATFEYFQFLMAYLGLSNDSRLRIASRILDKPKQTALAVVEEVTAFIKIRYPQIEPAFEVAAKEAINATGNIN